MGTQRYQAESQQYGNYMKLPLLLQSSNQHCLYLLVTIGKHLEVSPREGLQQRMDRNFFIIPWGCKL